MDINRIDDGQSPKEIDVSDAPVPESCHQFYLNVAGTGRIKQEPTDKRQPQPAKVRADKESIQARQDKHKGDGLTYLGCESRGAVGIASNPPDYGTQDTPAVQRVTGNHVEGGQHDVDVTKPDQHGDRGSSGFAPGLPTSQPTGPQDNQTDCDTRNGTSDRNPEFGLGVRGFRFDLRNATQGE